MGLLARSSSADRATELSLQFLDELFKDYPTHQFGVRLWDGTTWGERVAPRFTLVLNHAGALRSIFSSPSEVGIGEAYVFKDFDIEGDLRAAFELSDFLLSHDRGLTEKVHLATLLGRLPANRRPRPVPRYRAPHGDLHSKKRDRQAVTYHYDVPPEFFAVFLDRNMVYSCAYFCSGSEDLDTAQEQKLDYICRKLRLRKGERLLDIGCGWGALIIHAAKQYGADCLGITLSSRQAEVARARICEAGVQDRCAVQVCDYRDLKPAAQFDKIASVGMFEHVGEPRLPEYFQRAYNLLRSGGIFLNHGIARSATYHPSGPAFTDVYVFPDGELVPISTSLRVAEQASFEVRDVESLREHYVLTLHHWLERLQAGAHAARQAADDTTLRIWQFYIAGSAHWFKTAKLNLFQTLLCKPRDGNSGLPLTRADWYCT